MNHVGDGRMFRGRVSNGASGWENECSGLGNDHLCSGGGGWT